MPESDTSTTERRRPSASRPQSNPLVNETLPPEPGNLEDALKVLADSREENRRLIDRQKHFVPRDEKEIDELRTTIESLKTQLKQATSSEITGDGGIYTGPSQRDIYLAIVTGIFSNTNVLKSSDPEIRGLSSNAVGICEVFYKEASQRKSFNK